RLGRDPSAVRAVEGKAQHIARMHRNADAMPVVDHPAVLLQHAGAGVLELEPMLAVVGVLILGGEVEIVGVERLDADEGLVASSASRQIDEALAAPMLGALGLARREIG